jgi:tetratricopeptide (TPR) repeat protein
LADTFEKKGYYKSGEEYLQKIINLYSVCASGEEDTEKNLLLVYDKMGDLKKKQGDLQGAERYYSKCMEFLDLQAVEDGSVVSMMNYSVMYNKIGELSSATYNLEQAKTCFEKSIALCKKIAEASDSDDNQRELALCYCNIGEVLIRAKDYENAKGYLKESRAILENLLKNNDSIYTYNDLAITYQFLGILGDRTSMDMAVRIWAELYRKTGMQMFHNSMEKAQSLIIKLNL